MSMASASAEAMLHCFSSFSVEPAMDSLHVSSPVNGSSSEVALLTAEEVAQILRVPRSWVYGHLNELPVIRLGRYVRFRHSEIVRFLEQGNGRQELANDAH
jgi:excisionase family DNA binding protein